MKEALAGLFLTAVSAPWLYLFYQIARHGQVIGKESNPFVLYAELAMFAAFAAFGIYVAVANAKRK